MKQSYGLPPNLVDQLRYIDNDLAKLHGDPPHRGTVSEVMEECFEASFPPERVALAGMLAIIQARGYFYKTNPNITQNNLQSPFAKKILEITRTSPTMPVDRSQSTVHTCEEAEPRFIRAITDALSYPAHTPAVITAVTNTAGRVVAVQKLTHESSILPLQTIPEHNIFSGVLSTTARFIRPSEFSPSPGKYHSIARITLEDLLHRGERIIPLRPSTALLEQGMRSALSKIIRPYRPHISQALTTLDQEWLEAQAERLTAAIK